MRGKRRTWQTVWALVLVLALAVFVGCGSDDDDDGSASTSEETTAETADLQVEPKTIGVTSIVLTAGSSQRLLSAVEEAAAILDWDVIECDAAGDARQSDTCISSLMQQGAHGQPRRPRTRRGRYQKQRGATFLEE